MLLAKLTVKVVPCSCRATPAVVLCCAAARLPMAPPGLQSRGHWQQLVLYQETWLDSIPTFDVTQ